MNWNTEITEVIDRGDWIEISRSGLRCWLPKKYGVIPKVGDIMKVRTENLRLITAVDINGECAFSLSKKEIDTERKKLTDLILSQPIG